MATLKKTVSTKVENLVCVPAAEIEAMLRERYPHIPSTAGMTVQTDAGLTYELLEEIRFEWQSNEGDSNETKLPAARREPAAEKLRQESED